MDVDSPAVSRSPDEVGGAFDLVDESKLDKAAVWLAGGFTLLTSILTFFGIKEGVLDRLIRAYPPQTLLVFCLVGAGTIGGVTLGIFRTKPSTIPLYLVAILLLFVGVVVLVALPNFGLPSLGWKWTSLVTAVGIVAALALAIYLFVRREDASTSPAVAVLFVSAGMLTFGLYAAAKLSVTAKGFSDSPSLTVVLEGVSPHRSAAVTIRASKLDDGRRLRVDVVGDDKQLIGSSFLYPDGTGEIATTISMPLPGAQVRAVQIRLKVCQTADDCGALDVSYTRYAINIDAVRSQPSFDAKFAITNTFSPSFSFKVGSLTPQESVIVKLIEEDRSGVQLWMNTSRLVADSNGESSLQLEPKALGSAGNRLVALAGRCSSTCSDSDLVVVAEHAFRSDLYPLPSVSASVSSDAAGPKVSASADVALLPGDRSLVLRVYAINDAGSVAEIARSVGASGSSGTSSTHADAELSADVVAICSIATTSADLPDPPSSTCGGTSGSSSAYLRMPTDASNAPVAPSSSEPEQAGTLVASFLLGRSVSARSTSAGAKPSARLHSPPG